MCGIFALHDPEARPIDEELVRRQCAAMEHRGPDDEGYHFDAGVAIGMRRLSIVDLAGGHQPIANEDQTIWIVFNGEIYNQKELRHELEARGHKFRTQTDTEVIVHLYEEHGDACLERLNGMFGLALWDSRRRRLLVARDRLGIKPLYYTMHGGRVQVASEIKVLLEDPDIPRRVNMNGLHHYLHYLYVPGPETMFDGIHKLPPGYRMVCTDDELEIDRWWNVSFEETSDLSESEAVDALTGHLQRSIDRRLMADVPLGAYLSGGIDSSVIVAMMARSSSQPVKTFTLGFGQGNEEFNEVGYAREVAEAFGTEHHEFVVSEKEITETLDEIVWHFDEPFGGGLHTYFLSRMAKPHVTVALTGLGSDELFAGYDRQKRMKMTQWYMKLPPYLRERCIEPLLERLPESWRQSRNGQRIERLVQRAHHSDARNYSEEINLLGAGIRERVSSPRLLAGHDELDIASFLEATLAEKTIDSRWDRLAYLELKTTMVDDFLNYVDKMGMAHSMELRVPFLDHELVEFATSLPFDYKLRGFQTKYILKQASLKVLPERIVHRKKQPFFLPLGNWLRGDLRPCLMRVLDRDKLADQGFFDPDGVHDILEQHCNGTIDAGWPIWSLLVFQAWHDRFIESADVSSHHTLHT